MGVTETLKRKCVRAVLVLGEGSLVVKIFLISQMNILLGVAYFDDGLLSQLRVKLYVRI